MERSPARGGIGPKKQFMSPLPGLVKQESRLFSQRFRAGPQDAAPDGAELAAAASCQAGRAEDYAGRPEQELGGRKAGNTK